MKKNKKKKSIKKKKFKNLPKIDFSVVKELHKIELPEAKEIKVVYEICCLEKKNILYL